MERKNERPLMLLFSEHITNRLQYVAAFAGKELVNAAIPITTNTEEFQNYPGARINYSKQNFDGPVLNIEPHSLLFETGIRQLTIECFDVKKRPAFFGTQSDTEFDPFAAIFYLLSRYEEYLPHQADMYGRFDHKNSLAFRENFLHLPLVNLWLEDLRNALKAKFPNAFFYRNTFKYIPSYDIDIAWSYRHKGFLRNLGGTLRSVMRGDWAGIGERIAVLSKKRKDPFDSYEWLDALHLYCGLKPYYFFLVAERRGRYDKNISPSAKAMQELILYHSEKGTVGIHPSWQSNENTKLLKQEIGWLEFVTGFPIKHSRQHYLKMSFPQTYRELLKAGIEEDFTMGYGTTNGFRASVASSFKWYDLEKEETTPLVIFPFCFMDANAFYEEKLQPHQALAELMKYYQVVRQVNGMMVTIWHNNFLGTASLYKGWREVYEIFLKEEVYWDRSLI